MLKLLIQTVLERVDVALLEDTAVLGVESWISQKDEVRRILPAIEEMLGEAGRKWLEIGAVVVVVGKGNFSATRIGVTMANIIALATGAKIFEMELVGEVALKDILEKAQAVMDSGKAVRLAQPVYRSEPMISASKQKKFTE